MDVARPRGPMEKLCAQCGRTMAWRRKWARVWDDVRYCSDGCRRRPLNDTDAQLEQAIIDLLETRARGGTICPSEAARRIAPRDDAWRSLMQATREAARRLAGQGRIEFTQRGQRVDPSRARGPLRLRLVDTP